MDRITRSPAASKKFLFAVMMEMVLMYLFTAEPNLTGRLLIVSVMGFLAAGYIGGQAWLDRYVYMIRPEDKKNPEKNPEKNPDTISASGTISGDPIDLPASAVEQI